MAGEEIFSRFPTSYGWNEVDWVAPKAKTQPRQNRFRFRILQKRPEVFLGTHCDVLAWPFWENNENGIESFLFNSSPIRFVPTGRQLGKKPSQTFVQVQTYSSKCTVAKKHTAVDQKKRWRPGRLGRQHGNPIRRRPSVRIGFPATYPHAHTQTRRRIDSGETWPFFKNRIFPLFLAFFLLRFCIHPRVLSLNATPGPAPYHHLLFSVASISFFLSLHIEP